MMEIWREMDWLAAEFPWLPLLIAGWLGACFGSFSNVLVYRLPRNLSVVRPRSFCPACGRPIRWFDNIPLLSWMLLRGRCRRCGESIPARYLLLEAAGAVCALAGLLKFGWTVEGLAAGVFLLLLLDIALIDWRHMIIPHTLTVFGMASGLALAALGVRGLAASLLGLVTGAGIILAVSLGYKVVRGTLGMGGGDVMLMGMVGAFLGPWNVLGVLFGGALLGTVYALSTGRGKIDGGAKLPFGTFLAAGAAIVLFAGRDILAWYAALI